MDQEDAVTVVEETKQTIILKRTCGINLKLIKI